MRKGRWVIAIGLCLIAASFPQAVRLVRLRYLMSELESKDDARAASAAQALARTGSERGMRAIVAQLAGSLDTECIDGYPGPRNSVEIVPLVLEIGERRQLEMQKVVQALSRGRAGTFLDVDTQRVEGQAAMTMESCPCENAALKMLLWKEDTTREGLLRSAIREAGSQAAPALRSIFRRPTEPETVRAIAGMALARISSADPVTVACFQAASEDSSPSVTAVAKFALRQSTETARN